MEQPVVLSLGGWDPSGGAGLAADIKTFEAHGVLGMGLATALTFQSHDRFEGLTWVTEADLLNQLQPILAKYRIAAVKIGLVQSAAAIGRVLHCIRSQQADVPVVWDPVLKASAGFGFHPDLAGFTSLLGMMTLTTPNLHEAQRLFGQCTAAPVLNRLVEANRWGGILLKGGHAVGHANDLLLTGTHIHHIEGERFTHRAKHGSGCVLSSAIAANLAKGATLPNACTNAKRYTERFLLSSPTLLGTHYMPDTT